MAWNISATAIRNPAPPIMLFLALLVAGLTAFFRLPINQMPNIEFPTFMVVTARPGAAPSELEAQVAQKIEASLTSIDGVKRMSTTIRPGVAETLVELRDGVDLSRAIDDARDAISRVRADLPGDIDEPVIVRMDAAAEPIGWFGVEAPGMSPEELSWFIDNDLSRELLAVKGVSAIGRFGGADREIRVELDPDRMLAFGATADDVNTQLVNLNVDAPGGRAQVGGLAQSIRTLGSAQTVESLTETRINLSDGKTVRLGDIAIVRDGASEPDSSGRYDGRPAVGFNVQRSKTASEVQTYDLAVAKMREIERKRPDVKIRSLGTSVDFVRALHESSLMSILEGTILAVIVVFVVLKDWRATVLSAIAIPLSIIPTFAVIELFGFTLNFLTMMALGLVVGVLVDDAIVEVENIVRHARMGKRPYRAALEAADEIGLAVVATSFAIVAVFVPVAFMSGTTGQFFKSFGITVAVAVLFSLLVARLITPLAAAFFLKSTHHDDKPSRMRRGYVKMLSWAVRRPWMTVGLGMLIFIFSVSLVRFIPMTFTPRWDADYVQTTIEFSPGTTHADGDAIARKLSDQVLAKPYVKGLFQSVDGANGAADTASLWVYLKARPERKLSSFEVQQDLRPILNSAPNVRAFFTSQDGPSAGADITLDFVGDNPPAVAAAADKLVAEIKKFPELADVKSSASLKRPEIAIRPKADQAALQGVSAAAIATAVRVATGGEIDQRTAKFGLGDRQIPIRVLLAPWARQDLDSIKALRIHTNDGRTVRLDSVADISFGLGDATLQRRDRERKVSVTANVVQGEIGDALKKVQASEIVKNPGQGVRLLTAGNAEEMEEMVANFSMAMIWGVLLIYSVLVLLFRDFFQPITIMTALPLSFGGAFIGLLVSGQPLSVMAFIGILMLMGIVTKNSILLVDFAVERMHAGMTRREALMEAGAKRVRPIVMTTIAMSAGMLPLALGLGPDGALRQGMGIVVIGGLIMSTALSLIFIPAVFILVSKLENWIGPTFGKISTYDSELDAEHTAVDGAPAHPHGASQPMRPAAE